MFVVSEEEATERRPDTHAPRAADPAVASNVGRAEALAWQVDDVAPATPTIPVKHVGITGAGTTGRRR